jgi:hypothetical protein
LQLEELSDGTNVYWSSTCEGSLVNFEGIGTSVTYPGAQVLPKLGTTIKFNAGLNVVNAKSSKILTSKTTADFEYVLSDAALALTAGLSAYAATSSLYF